jgi:ElaA protein
VSHIDVHIASFDELDGRTAYLLWQLREAVFVVEQACAYPELDGRDLEPGTRHLWVEYDEQPAGYLRILDDGDRARIGRVLVAPTHRRRGLAALLVGSALDQIGERRAHLDAQSYLAGWYARFGFTASGEEFLEDGIAHLPMERPAQSVRTRP